MYVINGKPIPLSRHRVGQGGVHYDPQKKEKLLVGIGLTSQHDDRPLFDGPLELTITFYFEPTRTKPRDGWHNFKPDLSNLVKFIEDVSSGILYKDDAIISSIIAKKLYDKISRTEFTLKELK